MSKKQNSKRKSAASDTNSVEGNVDKIRDILFGPQMRDYESRIDAMEKRLSATIERSARDLERRVERLDAYTRREVQKVVEQIRNERKDRIAEGKKGAGEVTELAEQVEAWFAEVDEQHTADTRDLRDSQHEQVQELSQQIREAHDHLQKALQKEASELTADKLGREDLAALLTEVAMRLNKDFKLPKG